MLKSWQHKSKFAQIFQKYDSTLIMLILAVTAFGLIAIFNASSVSAFRDFGDQFYYVKDQALYAGIGLFIMFILSQVNYQVFYKLSIPLLFITLLLLLGVFIPGLGVKALGAKRWLNLGFITVQPTEFAKLALTLYLSAWFSYPEKGRLIPFLILLSLVVGLVVMQPDLGTAAIILAIAGIMFFVSGAPLINFVFLVPLVVTGLITTALAAPYRLARLKTFLNPNLDPLGDSYHIRQILIALGAGGLLGVGIGKSRQKFEYLPEATTDSIFAIIAEELGFLGSILLIAVFGLIVYRIYDIAKAAPDRFGKLLAFGIGSWFAVQTIINLGAMVAIIPLTGVPLPFISYGGSNLITLLSGFGILLNIGRQKVYVRR